MYRVLIVDDEPWVAYGLSKLINWEEHGFEVVGEAHDGLTAIELITQENPEVVISDIRMPGLDGIELLEEIRRRKLNATVVLVSGYSEFHYAQQALKLGAFDYLLKQVDKRALGETMSRLKEKLDDEQQMNREPDGFLNDLFDLLDHDSPVTIDHFLTSKGYRFQRPQYCIVSCQFPYATVSHSDQPINREGIEYLSFRTGHNQTTLLCNYDDSHSPNGMNNWIVNHFADAVHVGSSTAVSKSALLSKLYREADIALFSSICNPALTIITYKDRITTPELSAELLLLELAIKEQRTSHVKELLASIGNRCIQQNLLADQVTGMYNQIVSLLHKYYSLISTMRDVEFMTYDQVARQYGSYHQLFGWLEEVFGTQHETEWIVNNERVKEIMRFIDARYTEDIVLGDVAKHFSMSIGYLSSLIKKQTGKGYSEYITAKRIQRAKELLVNPTLSVQEVVQSVGYKDYFHFNKLFKKHVGLTPSKFRRL